MAVYWRSNRLGHNRLGITTGTKLGHAVVRNKMRRRVREIMRRHSGELRQGMDLVIVVRQRAVQSDYWRMDRDFLRTADKLGILHSQEAE
jgi:ribonuclease P protein component